MSAHPARDGRLLAGPHNARLGPAIHAFNLPATPDTCVGATPACSEACYAKGFLFRLQRDRHLQNLERSLEPRFAASMIAEVRRAMARAVRIHASGDFYGPAYAAKWAEVARACPGVSFFAYTRSWRVPEVLAELAGLARLPNLSLWFSSDRDSGQPPAMPGVRQAYLLARGEAEAGVPPEADLVFRVPLPRRPGQANSYERPSKRIGGVLVCPKEQGVDRKVEITCSSCRICFSGPMGRATPPRPMTTR